MRKLILIAAAMSGSLALAAPVLAQDAASDAKLPTCSATVTDHCMQREHRAMLPKRHASWHHKTMHHKAAHHRMAHRHTMEHHAK